MRVFRQNQCGWYNTGERVYHYNRTVLVKLISSSNYKRDTDRKEMRSWKKIVLSSITIGLILLAISYYSGLFFDMGVSACIIPPPPHVMVDGIASAKFFTWNDVNENGAVDEDEPVLPNVEIVYPFASPKKYTNNYGNVQTAHFKPGCACKCWEQEYVEVATPKGYRATTPLRKEMIGDNLTYMFGFVKLNP